MAPACEATTVCPGYNFRNSEVLRYSELSDMSATRRRDLLTHRPVVHSMVQRLDTTINTGVRSWSGNWHLLFSVQFLYKGSLF